MIHWRGTEFVPRSDNAEEKASSHFAPGCMKEHGLPKQVLRGSHWQQLQQAGSGLGISLMQELSMDLWPAMTSVVVSLSSACSVASGLQTGDVAVGAHGARLRKSAHWNRLFCSRRAAHKGPTAVHRPAAKILAARRNLTAEPAKTELSSLCNPAPRKSAFDLEGVRLTKAGDPAPPPAPRSPRRSFRPGTCCRPWRSDDDARPDATVKSVLPSR